MAQDIANAEQLPELLSATDLAAYLGVPVSTIFYWRSLGKGPPALKIGKRLHFRAADVATWLARHEGGDEA